MQAHGFVPYVVGVLSLVLLWLLYKVASGGNIASLYEGNDGRPSTSKFQFFAWTAVVIFSYTAIYSMKVGTGDFKAINELPTNVLIAMGMSVISAAAAKGITVSYISTGRIAKTSVPSGSSTFGAILQDDQGFPDLSKVQMIAWTFIAIATYLIAVGSKIHKGDHSGLPDIDSALMVLMGLGQGAYLGKKLVSQDTSAPPTTPPIGNGATPVTPTAPPASPCASPTVPVTT
jgi:hypothetical protein